MSAKLQLGNSADHSHCPTGWRDLPLSAVADIRFSSVDKKSESGEKPVRLCNYTDVYNNDYVTADMHFMRATATITEIDRFRLSVGDVIITKDSETPNDIGVPAVIDSTAPDLLCGYHLALIRPNPQEVDSTFLAKQLGDTRIARYFGQQANGSTRYGLSTASIAGTRLHLPSLPQQKAASQIIRLLDSSIAKTGAVIAKLKQVRAGLLHDLLTRGLDHNGELRDPIKHPNQFKDSPLGKIPRDWHLAPARDLCYQIAKGTTPASLSSVQKTDWIPFIRVQNLTFDGSLSFGEDCCFVAPQVHYYELSRSRVFPGDVLMNLVGPPMGKVSVVPTSYPEWNINQAIAIFRTLDPTANRYLGYFLLSAHAFAWFRRQAKKTSGQMNLTLEMCRDLPIPCQPTLAERCAITDRLEALDHQIFTEVRSYRKLVAIKQGLMSDLLTGRVPVPETIQTGVTS